MALTNTSRRYDEKNLRRTVARIDAQATKAVEDSASVDDLLVGVRHLTTASGALARNYAAVSAELRRVTTLRQAGAAKFQSLGDLAVAVARSANGRIDGRLQRAPTGASAGDPSSGGFLIETQFVEELIGSLYDDATLAPLCSRVEASGPLSSVKIPGVDETSRADGSRWGGAQSYWASEADSVSASLPRWRTIEFSAKKLFGICYATGELLADAPLLESHLTRAFAAEIGYKLDAAIFSGSGAGQPLGILNSGAKITIAKEVGQAAATIVDENIRKMWSRLPIASRRRAVWLVHEDVAAQLDAGGFNGMYLPAGAAGNALPLLKGRPVVEIEQASALGTEGDIVLADMSQYGIIDSGLRTDLSIDARFVEDEAIFRFICRVDGSPLWASPITVGGTTRSPFVTIEARA